MRRTVRIPLWAALVLPVVAYLVRSLVLRGGDFAPDVPQDVIALTVFAIGIAAYVLTRRHLAEHDPSVSHDGSSDADDAAARHGRTG